MAASFDLVRSPSFSDPLLDTLVGPLVYRPGYTVTYVLAGRAGSQGSLNDGGIRWASGGARDAFENAVAAWNAVSNLVIKPYPFYFAEGDDRSSLITWVEKIGFQSANPDELGRHDTPGAPEQEGEFNAQSSVWSRENNAVGGYNFVTFLHEIGHGLGLEHPHEGSPFPGVTTSNDKGAFGLNQGLFTVMSYNDGYDKTGYSPSYAYGWMATPGALDIAAVQAVYGANMSTRAGDDVYKLASVNGPGTSFSCIWDAGGADTISGEGLTIGCTIDLRPATLRVEEGGGGFLSRAQGIIGGFTIAAGAIIENAVGGAADDRLIGNDAANRLRGGGGNDLLIGGGGRDELWGGAGADLFSGTRAELGGDVIADFALGDRIAVTDAAPGGLAWSRAGDQLRLGDGRTVTLAGAPNLRIVTEQASAGATLKAVRHDAQLNDFDGDGRADILWTSADGGVATWSLAGIGSGRGATAGFFAGVDPSWRALDAFDWNGDGRSDILWRNTDGALAVWAATEGGFDQASWYQAPVGGSWRIAGTGDFNADGRDDLLWRDADGASSVWTSTGAGFQGNGFYRGPVGADWKVAGLGDLNGDGLDDVVWRNDGGAVSTWLADGRGGAVGFEGNSYFAAADASWRIAGVADLNGDGLDDLLWRNDGGAISIWRSTGSGFSQNSFFDASVGSDWRVAQVADMDADGRADILWRSGSGAISVWRSAGDDFIRNSFYDGGPASGWGIVGGDVPVM